MASKNEFVEDCLEQEREKVTNHSILDRFHFYDVKVDARTAFDFAKKYNYKLVKKK